MHGSDFKKCVTGKYSLNTTLINTKLCKNIFLKVLASFKSYT